MPTLHKKRLAIIGAGPSGLAAAWKLRDSDSLEITIFDKSRGVSGRAASRTRHGLRLDPGANYFKTDQPEVAELIHNILPTDELIEIKGGIDVFDWENQITPGDATQNAEQKWTYQDGISTVGKLLAKAAGIPIQHSTRVGGIRQNPDSQIWEIKDDTGNSLGHFNAILLTIPAPQALELLATEDIGLAAALAPATYQRQWTFTFGYDAEKMTWPGDSYALINLDRKHDIAWLSRENAKPGRIPDDTLAIMAQMSPDWSFENFESDPGELAISVNERIATLLSRNTSEWKWLDFQRWKFSLPTGKIDPKFAHEVEACGIYLAGDGIVGKGRVSNAIQSGLDIAGRIAEKL